MRIGNKVFFSFKSEFRGTVKVEAEVIDMYQGLYHKGDEWEMSIRYNDLGDTITEHGILVNDPRIHHRITESNPS